MKKLLFLTLLVLGSMLSFNQEVKAQRIEYDSLGMPHACTNYDLHMKENRQIRVGRLAAYAGVIAGLVLINQAVYGQDAWNQSAENLAEQSYYALGAAIGAVVVVGIYKWDVKMKSKAGL